MSHWWKKVKYDCKVLSGYNPEVLQKSVILKYQK